MAGPIAAVSTEAVLGTTANYLSTGHLTALQAGTRAHQPLLASTNLYQPLPISTNLL